MKSAAVTVDEYLKSLSDDRREAVSAVRKVIRANLSKGFEECIGYGMIGYVVPHSIHPAGYHCNPKLPLPYANLGSQKSHMVLHLLPLYCDEPTEEWFRKAWTATGKKLDMGKGCVRFKKLEDVPLEVIGQAIARFSVKEYIGQMEMVASKTSKKKTKGKK